MSYMRVAGVIEKKVCTHLQLCYLDFSWENGNRVRLPGGWVPV